MFKTLLQAPARRVIVLSILFTPLLNTNAAEATTYTIGLSGNSSIPLEPTATFDGGAFGTVGTLDLLLDDPNSNLVLTYDDGDTASVADDIVSITGQTVACISNCDAFIHPFVYGYNSDIVSPPSGKTTLEFDITLVDPLVSMTSGPDEFAFSAGGPGEMKSVGTVKSLDLANPAYGGSQYWTTDVSIKNDKDYAFRVFEDGTIEGWMIFTDGFLLGLAAHGEFGPPSVVVNWDLQLDRPSVPPTTEVPEPATAALLLLGGAFSLRRKTSSSLARSEA